jgi:hypothetical protein
MGKLERYYPFFTSALLMWAILFIIYPHYQYYIDPDGTAYLTIAKRYANGDLQRAINGYWSPCACWLTAGLIKLGLSAIPASVIVNALGATGFVLVSQSLFLRFSVARQMQWLWNITLALFLCYAIFWQSFDDLWECFFLLLTLRLLLCEGYKNKPALWVLYGCVGALAYFAKAYSFPFFILNTVCCTYFIVEGNKVQWLKICAISIGIMILCSLPWIMVLHDKYGIWTTSTSGTLNMSWYLLGHPQWKAGIDLLIPPAYPDSPYYWEDPWIANGATPHFWNSWRLFGLQLLRIGYNLLKFLGSILQLSIFFPLVLLALLRFVWITYKNWKITATHTFTLVLSFLLFPPGYLLINFEPRYLWYMVPLSMLAASVFIFQHLSSNHKIFGYLPYIFAVSYLVYPAMGMIKMYDIGKDAYTIATALKQRNIHGSFAAYAAPGADRQSIERIAYFSGNPLYTIQTKDSSNSKLLQEMRRYSVDYMILYNASANSAELNGAQFSDEKGNQFPSIYIEVPGVKGGGKVFRVKQ